MVNEDKIFDLLCCVVEDLQEQIIENDEFFDFSHRMRIAHQIHFVRAWQEYTKSNSRTYPSEMEVYFFAERGVKAANLIKRMRDSIIVFKARDKTLHKNMLKLLDDEINEADAWLKENGDELGT